jgi:putative ABC transport system substrate-binding protein
VRDIEPAARALGLQVRILEASTPREIDAAFAALANERLGGLFLGVDPFFTSRRVQLANSAARHGLAMISATREIPEVAGSSAMARTLRIDGVKSVFTSPAFSRERSRRSFPWCNRASSSW